MRIAAQLPPEQGLEGPEQLRLSSDGSMLVYTGPAEEDGDWQLWAHRWSAGTGRPIPNTTGVFFFDPSPENDEVAVVSEGSLRVGGLGSSSVRTLVSDGAYCCVTWGDEGDWIYYTNAERGVSRVSPRGGEPEVLTNGEEGVDHEWPSPIPGKNLVVFERAELFGMGSRIAVLDPGSGEIREVGAGSHPMPFGHLILFTSEGSLPDLRYANGLEEGAVATTIATSVGGDALTGRPAFDVSATGDLVYSEAGGAGFSSLGMPVWVERDGTETPIDPTLIRPLQRVRLSPDGSRLVLFGLLRGVTSAIHVKEVAGGPLVRLTPQDELNRNPFWAPDGSWIYFTTVSRRDTTLILETRRVRPDGAGEPENVGLPWPEATMTRDGEWWIYRTPNVPEDSDLMAVRADLESEPIPLVTTEAQEAAATVSRDGRWIAYSSDRTGVRQVYVRPFPDADGSRVQITDNGGVSPAFSPGTDELFVVEDGWMVAHSYTTEPTFRVTVSEPLFDVSAYSIGDGAAAHNYDVTPEGETFVMVRRLDPSGDGSSTLVLRLDFLTTLQQEASR